MAERGSAGWAFEPQQGPGVAVAEFLHSLPAPPQLLAVGEPTHGLDALPRLRNQLFAHLADHLGYRSIAIESDCLSAFSVDNHVAGAAVELDDTMRTGFSHGFGGSDANRELVAWLTEQNRSRAPRDRLRFYGFDAPMEMAGANSPRAALAALHCYLATTDEPRPGWADIDSLLGSDERWTNPAAALEPKESIGAGEDVAALRIITDDLGAQLVSDAPRLIGATSEDAWWRASTCARTARGLLRYHAAMADDSPTRVGRLMGLRDAMMAENLLDIAAREARRGPTLVFAHTRHLQRNPSFWQLGELPLTWWSAGAVAASQLGAGYALVAMSFGAAAERGIAAPASDTVEGRLAGLLQDGYVIDAKQLAAAGPWQPRTDHTPNQGYFPLEPDHLDGLDAVLFLRDV